MIACKLCKAQFPPSGGPTQGHGCASSFYQKDGIWYVCGHYGSRLFDMNLYKVVEGQHKDWSPCPTEPTDPICDICISVWERLGRLVLLQSDVL